MPPKSKKARQKRNLKIALGSVGALAVILIIVGVAVSPLSPFLTSTTTTTTPLDTTSISIFSYPDSEDVSNIVEVDIWVPKSTADISDIEDIYTISNFELLGSTTEAENINVDLSDYDYVWIEIDPDGTSYFENDFKLITGGVNYDLSIYAYHLVSDVNFNMVDSTTMNEITVSGYQTDGNYTILFDCPHHTTSDIHANTADWSVDDDQWDDMSATEKEYYYDEANFRCLAPTYDPSNTTTHAKQHPEFALALDTKYFAFKMTFNDSISDSGVTAVDITIDDNNEDDVYKITSGDTVYLIFDKIIKFTSIQQIGLEMDFGANITLSDIDSILLEVPGSAYSSGSMTVLKTLSDIAV